MMQSNLNIAAEITEITEKSDRFLQFAFAGRRSVSRSVSKKMDVINIE